MLALAITLACNQALAASEKILWSFGATGDGVGPMSGLLIDGSGNLYGTTEFGGSYYFGTAFKLTPDGQESVLWSFGSGTDGYAVQAGFIMDKNGNLYSTAEDGGIYDNPSADDFGGIVFELTPDGQESILWNFGNGSDGQRPRANLLMDAKGNFYGTTFAGGIYPNNFGGTAFEVTPDGRESVLWNFGNGMDGRSPSSSLIMDAKGNLYGTTGGGGAYDPSFSFQQGGTVFKLTPPAGNQGSWNESILWSFGNGSDGFNPLSGLIMDAHGNLFGTTIFGGTYGKGTVFEVTPDGQESVLWNFREGTDGHFPIGALVMDTAGNLYGATVYGGAYHKAGCQVQTTAGCGAVFKLTPPAVPGGAWSESILWSFGNGTDGFLPLSGLITDTSGNLYGTTEYGGINGGGTVFEISNSNAPGGQIAVSSQRIEFPNTALGSTSSFQLGIRNTGKGQLTGTVNPPASPFGLSGSGSFNLSPNTQTFITLTFTPTSANGAHRPDTVVSNSTQQSMINLDLRGTGIAGTVALNHSSPARN